MRQDAFPWGPPAVLTIGKLGASVDQLAYYEQQVAQGIEDYFSGRGEAPCRWIGGGCGGIGLRGQVDRTGFMRAMHCCDPRTGEGLPPRRAAAGGVAIRRHRRWCERAAVPAMCLVQARGVQRLERDVLVVSIDRLVPALRVVGGVARRPRFSGR